VERKRSNVIRHGIVARRGAVTALSVADLQHAALHRADEVVEVPAEVVRKQPLTANDRNQPFDGVALLVRRRR
jgi:hypothetical protein